LGEGHARSTYFLSEAFSDENNYIRYLRIDSRGMREKSFGFSRSLR